ncbi:glycosyltransferase family A protein [Salinibius halmophilus]|uniref:glycosyltransferase family A protein n=1 Tax=Salinibius halmophilus TaxID=1853216 RepID=UPI000E661F46|nr:glycosyltransferase family A protein [Salinibius halmophilus]
MTPVVVFVYKRCELAKDCIESLKSCTGADETDLIVFSDGARNESDKESVDAVRRYLRTVSGFASVVVHESHVNMGLANSIVTGVDAVLDEYGSVIVVEDDLVVSDNFLVFMNKCLEKYRYNRLVWSVSGFSYDLKGLGSNASDIVAGLRAASWGWATWKDRWDKVDWDMPDLDEFLADPKAQKEFKRGGSDLVKMLRDYRDGKISSWAIRFCYAQFKNKMYDVFPTVSKVESAGFTADATHTTGMDKRFRTVLDQSGKTDFILPDDVVVDPKVEKQFRAKFSLPRRAYYRILSKLKL